MADLESLNFPPHQKDIFKVDRSDLQRQILLQRFLQWWTASACMVRNIEFIMLVCQVCFCGSFDRFADLPAIGFSNPIKAEERETFGHKGEPNQRLYVPILTSMCVAHLMNSKTLRTPTCQRLFLWWVGPPFTTEFFVFTHLCILRFFLQEQSICERTRRDQCCLFAVALCKFYICTLDSIYTFGSG